MNKLMCRFEATMKKKKKIASPILDTVCPQGILRNNFLFSYDFMFDNYLCLVEDKS